MPYINEATLSEEGRNEAMKTMGMPTDRVQGKHISELQTQPRDSNGHRSYKIQKSLSNVQDQTALFSGQNTSGVANNGAGVARVQSSALASSPPTVKGVARGRTVNRLLQSALHGTPNTQSLAEDCYNDFLMGKQSTAMGYMRQAEQTDEPEENEEGEAPSQQIAKNTMHFKKLERKRNSI